MIELFSSAGRTALHAFIDQHTLFAFDLDGTLAPIVPDPAGIEISAEVRQRLLALGRNAPLAVITGRARADAESHLGFTPGFLIGNHGAEGLPGREEQEQAFVRLCRDWKKQLAEILPEESRNGIVLEDKGATLTLHYRSAPDREQARQAILQAVSQLRPAPRLVGGKLVENLLPPGACHKGEALRILMAHKGYRRALFVGDDETDEDVFRLGDAAIFGIRIGNPATSAAGYALQRQDEIGALLDAILTALPANPEAPKPDR